MAEFPSTSNSHNFTITNTSSTSTKASSIPIEIVSEEEMAEFEAALATTPSSSFQNNAIPCSSIRSNASFTLKKRTLSSSSAANNSTQPPPDDIEESLGLKTKRSKATQSLFSRFRKNRGLSVTDITSTEWCEKRMEYVLTLGKRETDEAKKAGSARHLQLEEEEWYERKMECGLISGKREAMKAGTARHIQLEEEVVTKVKVSVETSEDFWALKFMNFITAANQLLLENMTREIPIIGFFEGVPLVGKVDEIRMPGGEVNGNPMLVDTKTRVRDILPPEAQKRNGRLQLMCYKYLWDNLVADKFPFKTFFEFFSLDPDCKLSEDIREKTTNAGFRSETLLDLEKWFRRTCRNLHPANNQMLLRYELQKDNSLLGEEQFAYDPKWFNSQIKGCLEFWLDNREASYVPEKESWKCRYCEFASDCPGSRTTDTSGNSPTTSYSSSDSQTTSDMSSDAETTYETSCDSEASSSGSRHSSYYYDYYYY